MRLYIFIFFSVLIFSGASAQSTSEQALLNLSKKKFEWMVNMNYDSLEPMLDEQLQFIHSSGWSENKKEFIEDIKSGKLRYNAIDVVESSVRLFGQAAVVIGRGKFSVKLDGKDLQFDLKYTEVYIRKNGKWLLASRHSNRML